MSFLLLTHGPTHSGKTTFGSKLRAALGDQAKFIHVDNDLVDGFIKANFNNLRTDPAVLAKRTPSNPDLRLLIPRLIAGYALGEGYSVIATAAHPKAVIRQAYYDIAASSGSEVVLLIFRITDEQARRRIHTNNRDTSALDISPHTKSDFNDLYDRQKSLMEEPTEDEKLQCYRVFEVTEDTTDEVLGSLVELVRAT